MGAPEEAGMLITLVLDFTSSGVDFRELAGRGTLEVEGEGAAGAIGGLGGMETGGLGSGAAGVAASGVVERGGIAATGAGAATG